MRITVNTTDLLSRMPAVNIAAPARPSLPILAAIVIEASDAGIRARCSDLELAYGFGVDGDVHEPGSIAVNARALAKALRAVGRGKVVELRSGESGKVAIGMPSGATVRLDGLDADDAPSVAWPDPSGAGEPASTMIAAMARAEHAAARDDSRPVLAALRVSATDGRGLVEAADGFRLARVGFDAGAWSGDCLVPRRVAALATKANLGAPRVLVTGEGNRQLWLVEGDQAIGATVLGGYTFPDLDKIVPSASGLPAAIVQGDALTEALKVGKAAGGTTRLDCEAGEDELMLVAFDDEHRAVAEIAVPATFETARPATFSINPSYLADAVEDGHRFVIGHQGGATPVLLRRNGGGPAATFVVMPMHVHR